MKPNPTCPCRPPEAARPYSDCCGRYHAGPLHLQAPDAESLMRSRYSAFVQGLVAYVHDTWHPTTRPAAIEPNPAGLKWLGLDVRRHLQTGADRATVEFVARRRLGGRASRLHETSRFIREDGRWTYLDGDLR